jgi:RNA polymerase sigma factor (sigma-70 family)
MNGAATLPDVLSEQDSRITQVLEQEGSRLRGFIRRRVRDPGEAEDILQEVLFELIEAVRLLRPIEQAGAWVFQVARNRIIDRFRRNRAVAIVAGRAEAGDGDDGDEAAPLEDLLPSADAGPEQRYARRVLIEELDAALDELPAAQREVFVAHELEGRSFREMAQETGISINTLLARKRYAVLYLRERLQAIRLEFDDNP